jgi:hypothetical protein
MDSLDYIGVDFHPYQQTVAFVDKEGILGSCREVKCLIRGLKAVMSKSRKRRGNILNKFLMKTVCLMTVNCFHEPHHP